MDNSEFQLLKEHLDYRLDAIEDKIRDKKEADIERDRKIAQIEKKVFGFAIAISLIVNGPEAIKTLLKGLL